MTYQDDEVIAIGSGETKTLTRSKIDGDPGASKRVKAVVTCFTSNVAYRFGDIPVSGTNEYHLLTAGGDPLVIEGYDNLVNVQFGYLAGSAKLFVSYAD